MSEKEISTTASTETTVVDESKTPTRTGMGVLGASVAVVFGLVYAYDLWEALSTLLELPAYYALVGLESADVPWLLLIAGLLLPVLIYVLALIVGLRRNALQKALIFLVGLAVVASSSLTLVFLEQFLRPALQVVGL